MVLDLSIIIVSWNVRELLLACLRSLPAAAAGLACEAIVVDNASADGSAAAVSKAFPDIRLIANTDNLGFARANNQGIAVSTGRYVALLNSDTVPQPGALTDLVRFMEEHPQAGAVGPRLLRPNGRPQFFAFGGDPTPGYLLARRIKWLLLRRSLHDWATDRVQTVDWVSGACLVARREAIAQAGPLDENIFMYFEDNDWCLRFRRAGWRIYFCPQAAVLHLGGQSLARNPAARRAYYESLSYFYGKHYGTLARVGLDVMVRVAGRR